MFQEAPDNCFFDTAWADFLTPTTAAGLDRKYWGTYSAMAVAGAAGVATTTPTITLDQTLSLGDGN